ncbi:hypothetical protein JOF56_010059 [Kibdelosporangium banguiense]|uniref:Uncharacterized protein n=1 Tax=Kibdelosporangium banguiense TaxID=1365924 RepID=A0ABS4TZ34_9PSEU|nr:hypothetical protein [Kibdelosporangium banguiense]MBP2329674.1 hypothetical protein [Kibdelosporangium banguiense]
MDDSAGQLGRRGFVLGVAGLAFTTVGTATAQQTLSKAAGVAVLGQAAKALCLLDTSWVLVDEDGTTYPTTGLEGANVIDVAADDRGVLAVGSRPAPPYTEATIWQSADGVAWREVMRLTGTNTEFTGVGFGPGTAMALGSALSEERAPKGTIAARRWQRIWTEIPVTGLEQTAEQAITTVSGNRSGWVAAAITQEGTTLYRSPDGSAWSTESTLLEDAAVQGLLLEPNGIRWVANTIGGSAAITGTVGAGRQPVSVRQDAHAVGAVWTRRGPLSYWLVDGRLVTAKI